jgi:hypothetical protein
MSDSIACRYHTGECWKATLARPGRTKLHVVYLDDAGLVHRTVSLSEQRELVPLLHKGAPYPLERMVRKFNAIGRSRGMTQAAADEIQRAMS